uniref:Polypeptide N-acetylgalactosaminyltransferase n=1 Tax=Panagrolaimus sp. JU765 TaxID=591449 RepID=A0AC34Q299_9BILA
MVSRYFRIFLPRRKENVLNLLLAVILAGLLCFFYIKLYSDSHYKLPPEVGFTWPTPAVVLHTRPAANRQAKGPGENGEGVHLSGKEYDKGQADMKTWFMNVAASDKISLDRTIRDVRLEECKSIKYDLKKLPKASVVIIFTDEAWSPLLRTVHSVINRSPPELLKEVVLFDDNSQHEELKSGLDDYVKKFDGIVRIIRKKERHGLIRAKLAGAKEATGEVVVFLDSHCEANEGWLEPLVQRIYEKKSAVVCPAIDYISAETMSYSGDGRITSVGGFWWSLHFRWDPIPQKERERRKSEVEPVLSPTMAGGLLAADRQYFLDVGGYDPGMDIWGGENLEISFRVWMCGGSIEFIPCSHVGHIFRAGHPYNMTGPGGNKDVHGTNSKRLAEVWMDDYKKFYYMHRSDLKNKDVGDLSERHNLRKKLNCKSFKWYLDNIIPYKFIFDEDVIGFGSIRNPKSGFCLDTLQRDEKTIINLGVFQCQGGGSSAQMYSLTKSNQLRREMTCVEVRSGLLGKSGSVQLSHCSSSSQKWQLTEDKLMQNIDTKLCLDVDGVKNGGDVIANECDSSKETQQWEIVPRKW